MKCPICGKKYKVKFYNEDYYSVGYDASCPLCDYIDEECYGATRVLFCGHGWVWYHNTTGLEIEEIKSQINIAIEEHKGKPQFAHRKIRYYESDSDIPF